MKLQTFFVVLLLSTSVNAGPIAYALCQSGCNAVAVACYATAGFTFGTGWIVQYIDNYFSFIWFVIVTAGVGTPAAIVACNAALGMH